MTALSALWLPILLSAAVVFVVSSLINTVLPWHRNDYPRVPNEDAVQNALRPYPIPPGDYMLPRAMGMAEMRSEAFRERMRTGPVMMMTVMPNGIPSMARSLVLWFVYAVVVSVFAGYIAGRALPPGADYLSVFRFVGATAFIGYALALWQMSIWYHRAWSLTVKATIDGLLYGLLTGGVFGWLWPGLAG
ncbi:MAG: hypothetical protein P8Z36_05215 [Gemmatimonadota bacterium]